MSSCIEELKRALGDAILTGAEIGPRYQSDRSGSGRNLPLCVVRPASTEEVATALEICHRHHQTVVPQGGMTGLAGGANPSGSDVVISLERLRGIEEIDAASGTMVVKAGTPLEEAQEAARHAGLFLALDLGSRGSCQIGGNLSTNAGGIRVIRYGVARNQVLGIEAVLADGAVVSSMNRMAKNNTGLDLKHLFIGTEGTLGIITQAVLRLEPDPGPMQTALCALESYDKVVSLLRQVLQKFGRVQAFEAMWREYYRVTAEAHGAAFFDAEWPFWVILEQAGETADRFEEFLGESLEQGIVADVLIAQSEKQARSFWEVREGLVIDSFINLLNFDVSLPIPTIGRFAEQCEAGLKKRWPAAHVSFYGHIGDGNAHICVSTPYGDGEGEHDVEEIVYALVGSFGGSISAEHGIGILKRDYLSHSRSEQERAVMRKIKAALDPFNILNPGKILR